MNDCVHASSEQTTIRETEFGLCSRGKEETYSEGLVASRWTFEWPAVVQNTQLLWNQLGIVAFPET